MSQICVDMSKIFSFHLTFIELSEGLCSSHQVDGAGQIKRTKDGGFGKQLGSVPIGTLQNNLQGFWFIGVCCFQQICLAFCARRLIESPQRIKCTNRRNWETLEIFPGFQTPLGQR